MTDGETAPTGRIDKRTFLAAIGCHAAAWFARRRGDAPLTPALEWQFHCGNEVTAAAQAQLGSGTEFEVRFESGPFIARADAIRPAGARWDLIEVKSAKEPDVGAKIKAEYLEDLAYTAMVALGAGLNIERCVLMFLSRDFRRGNTGNALVELDVTDHVLRRAGEFAAIAPDAAAALLGDARPDAVLLRACGTCESFASECLGRNVATSIFVLPHLSDKKVGQFSPVVDLHKLPATVELTDNQRRVFEVIRSGKPLVMEGLKRLDEVVYPACYLDFETVAPYLPWFDGDGVHEVHPFQYSIHLCDRPGNVSGHREFIAPIDGDWRRTLVERLLDDLGEAGSIVVYTNFEEKRLEGLARLFPDLGDRIQRVLRRLFDLNDVVKNGYCHPGFMGRTSIKKVLPALVPGPGYAAMKIAEGQSASGVFGLLRAGRYDAATFPEWRQHLLDYCKLDTLAMVQVHQALAKVLAESAGG